MSTESTPTSLLQVVITANKSKKDKILERLPLELVECIIEYLDDKTRRNIALSCKTLQHTAINVERREFRDWVLLIDSYLIQPMEKRVFKCEEEITQFEEKLGEMGVDSLYVREFLKLIIPQKRKTGKNNSSLNITTAFHPSVMINPLEEWKRIVNDEGMVVWNIGDEVNLCESMVSYRKQLEHFKYWILRFYIDIYKDSFASSLDFMNLMSLKSSLYRSMTLVVTSKTEPFFHISNGIKSNRNFILKCIRRNQKIFKFVSDLYNDDLEIVKTVILNNPEMIKLASENLKDNDILARIVLSLDGKYISEFSDRIRGSLEFGLLAVSSYGCALQYLSNELRQNRDVVKKAVTNDGQSLNFAESFWNDKDIVLRAVKNSGHALIFASDELKRDREVVKTAVQQVPTAFGCLYRATDPYIISEWGEDEELVLLSENIDFASEKLKNDKLFLLKFIEINPNSYNYASPSLRNDREIVLALMKRSGSMLEYVNTEYRSKPQVPNPYETISNRDIVLAAVSSDGYALRFASAEWRNDFDIVMSAVQNDGLSLKYASNEMRDCDTIAIQAIHTNYHALEYISHRLQVSPEIIELSQSLKKK